MIAWRELYKAAMAETNPVQLKRLLAEAYLAMSNRVAEIGNSPEHAAERTEIEVAMRDLDNISGKLKAS